MLKTIQMILSLSPVRNLPPSGDQKRNFYFRIFYPTQSFYSSVERAKFQAPFAPQTPFIFFFLDVLRRFLKSYFPPSSPPFWRAILNINERKRERAQNIFRRPRPRHFFRRSRERNYKRANDAPNAVKAFSLNSVWPDLPTFRLFGNVLLILVKWFRAYSMFGIFLSLLWQNFNVFGPPFNVVQGQILKYNLAIWSHWLNQRTLTIGGWRITVRLDSSLTRQELTKKNKCYFLFVVKLVNLNL